MTTDHHKMAADLSAALMHLRAMLAPMHEFLQGEVALFESMGFTPEQSRDMASAEYTRLVLAQGGGQPT